MKIYLDGKMVEKADAVVSVFDHGLLYGDGVFEGIRSYNGRVFKLEEHLVRLEESAKAIMLTIPLSRAEMQKAVLDTMRANSLKDGYIRLVVTRGVGDLGLDPKKCREKGTVIIIADKITLYPEEHYRNGLEVVTVATRRNLPEAVSPKIKSLNYLNNIMAKIEANNAGVLEAIMMSADGWVAECTGDNIFIVRNGKLLTPPTHIGALDGITRATVMGLAERMGIPCSEALFTRYDVFNAEECFLTGTAAEIIPVSKVDSRPIGTGKPGPITLKLVQAYKTLTQTEGVPI
jgi:branched-chain amino acid aminotransferase